MNNAREITASSPKLLKIRKGDTMELFKKRLANLLTIKSIVTVTLTFVFAYLAITGKISAEQMMTSFTTVLAFYFGTQAEKAQKDVSGDA